MGEVYRARDTKLKREVAIKILPDEFSRDPDRVSRLQREAEVLASLNHPNIAGIHSLEEADGSRFLVLELVEGETLAERIKRGPIPVDESLNIARNICEALEAAHEKGVVHRDLKPANVKITPDGKVKVLDFGLAKAFETEASKANLSQSPTLSMAATNAGVILGTAAYMSPEQAKGRTVDKRTDIFAFGCVLYEMLTGRAAFDGDDVQDILGAVLKSEPDWMRLPAETPPGVRKLLRRCLEKNVKNRRSDAADVRIDIEEALAEPATPPTTPPARSARLAWIVAGILLLATAASVPFAIIHFREPVREDPAIRFDVLAPENATVLGAAPAISPDGKRLAFAASLKDKTQLWIRPLNSLTAQPLPGTENADDPFWSPDNRSVGFFADGKLKKIDVSGGPPQTLCNLPGPPRGGAWNSDGVIIFALGAGPLYRVSSSGGAAVPLTTVGAGETGHRGPSFLPDGRHFLFFATGKQGIYAGSLDTKDPILLRTSASTAAYAPPGYILFVQEGSLMAQRLDVGTLKLTGDAFPVAEHVGLVNATIGQFSVSDRGVIAYSSGAGGDRQLARLDRAGKLIEKIGSPTDYFDLALSPDQTRAAVQRNDNDLWIVDLIRGVPSRLTFNPAVEDWPVWSPDGSRVLFNFNANGPADLYSKASSGAGTEEPVLKSGTNKNPTDWSRDGRFVLYENQERQTGADLWVLPLFGDKKPQLFLQTPFNETMARFSPDGKWVAYVSDESGSPQVYVQTFPPSGGKWQISTQGGYTPRWRGDGKELFYMSPDRKIMSAALNPNGTTFEVSSPTALFQTQVDLAPGTNRYDVSPDGQRFLMSTPIENTTSPPITVITNWLAGIERGR
jgi:eukaryotic-like serine/threonine-protein kinase